MMTILQRVFGVACLCGVGWAAVAAPEPAWKLYQADPAAGSEAWRELVAQQNRLVEREILLPDEAYRKLLADERQAAAALKRGRDAWMAADDGVKRLTLAQRKAEAEYQALCAGNERRREIEWKRREVRNAARRLREYVEFSPAVRPLQSALEAIRNARQRRAREVLAASTSPEAQKMRRLIALAELAAEACDAVALDYGVVNNPFADAYRNLDRAVPAAEWRRQQVSRILARLREESPQANPENLERFARECAGTAVGFPDDPSPIAAAPEADPQDELYRLFRRTYRMDWRTPEFQREIRQLLLRLPRNSFARLQCVMLLRNCTTDSAVRWNRRSLVRREVINQIRAGRERGEWAQFYYNVLSNLCNDEDWKAVAGELADVMENVDPWLRQMIAGRTALVRAWDQRGGGYADTVSSAGWKGFAEELRNARAAFREAIRLRPAWGNPHVRLISVEMGAGSVADRINVFKEMLNLYPDIASAYENLAWGLLPRWGGSHRLIVQMAVAAMDTERYDTDIPSLGFCQLARAAWDSPDYRWKNFYRGNGIPEKGDRLFAARLEQARNDAERREFLLIHRALFEIATLRYDRALTTLGEVGGIDRLAAFQKQKFWRGTGDGVWFPLIPIYDDEAGLLRLFTGPRGGELQQIERDWLDGRQFSARERLAELIRTGKWSPEERDLLIDLYGRYGLECGGSDYFDCDNHKVLFNAFQVAGAHDDSAVAREMVALGFRYQQFESYPGETAVVTARNGVETGLLDLLKSLGDPLDRPEPKYGRAPMHVAAFAPNAAMVKKLLALGVSPVAPDRENHTPLQLAAARKGVEATMALLAAGADVDAQDNDGDTALMFVMEQNGPTEIWTALIKNSKNLNVVNHRGQSALHYAARLSDRPEVIRAMLAAGADPQLRDGGGRTPVDLARERGRGDFVALMTGGK